MAIESIIALRRSNRGATMLEYALIAACIAALCIPALSSVGTRAGSNFNNTATRIKEAGGIHDPTGNPTAPPLP